jgi:hypothetical protein
MPIAWSVDIDQRRALLTIRDPYTIEEWREALDALLEDKSLPPDFGVIVDRRESAPVTTKFVEQMASYFATKPRLAGAWAAIVVDTETGFGMGRMTGLKSELETPSLTIQTFRTYELAVEWLDSRSFDG